MITSETDRISKLIDQLNLLKKSILVVEDDSYDRELAIQAFSGLREKFYVDISHNGKEALERLVRQDYDIIFLDLKMPVMDGTDVLNYCREACPKTPVVIVTAYPNGDYMKSAMACAPMMSHVGVITKPLTKEIVVNTLQQYKLLS